MFKIITPDQFVTSPWKNGGGLTHEIARREADGAWVWRLSLAAVASDGPFSRFDGLSRILTVIEGNGITLQTSDSSLHAKPYCPVQFSGDVAVESNLIDGPIRDLNVIYDAKIIDAAVELIVGPKLIHAGANLTGFLHLCGSVSIGGNALPMGAFALGGNDSVAIEPDAKVIMVSLKSRS